MIRRLGSLLSVLPMLLFGFSGCRSLPEARLSPVETSTTASSLSHVEATAKTRGGTVIKVLARSEPYRQEQHGTLVTDAGAPETVLAEFSITLDGQDASPPPSEYAAFTNPHVGTGFDRPKIEEDATGRLYVYLSGGDGGSSHGRRFVLGRTGWLRTEFRDYVTGVYQPRRPVRNFEP